MTVMKKTEQKDDAVSPVVGVMLMLVVTIIIAAVVAAFASGVATDVEPAPSAVLKAEVDSTQGFAIYDWTTTPWTLIKDHGDGTVILTSLNGDAINLNNIAVTVTNTTGHSVTYSAPIHGYSSGETLESGESMNLGYSVDPEGNGFGLSHLGTTVKPGEFARVVVIYDDSHILYDKEVLVQ